MKPAVRCWRTLVLGTLVLVSAVANAQVYTMLSDLEKDKSALAKTDEEPATRNGGMPPPDAKEPTRAWTPRGDARASGSIATEDDDSSREKAATPAPEGPATVDRRRDRLAPRAPDDEESSSPSGGPTPGRKPELKAKGTAALPPQPEFPTADAAMRQRRKRKRRKFVAFTKSPSLLLATPVPNAVRTADDGDNDNDSEQSDKTGSQTQEAPETPLSKSNASGATLESQPGVVYPAGSKMAKLAEKSVSTSGSEDEDEDEDTLSGLPSNSSAKSVVPKSIIESPRDAPPSGDLTDDPVQESRSALVESAPPSPPSSSPASSSSTAAMADTASGGKSVMSNTLVLGLMMAGAVALVVLIGVFVYAKSAKNKGEADPVLFPAHQQDPNLGGRTAHSLSATADYHKDKNMTPTGYAADDDDDFFPSNGLHGQPKYDHDLDMFPPHASTALTQSQMSLPPMAQTGQSMASSEFSQYTTQSNFYGEDSAYTSATASTMDKYASYRPGESADDMAEYSEGESDFASESTSDLASTNNDWNAAVHERAPGSRVDRHQRQMMMGESQFDAANSRSTSASAYTGKTQFMESEYTEYRVSRDKGHSHAQGGKGYDNSFAPSDDGTYDGRYDGGKSFASSGFSAY